MDELRNRFRTLQTITTDAIRQFEHDTFTRLIYKSRNQHRHGLYFRRLEHVRRILRKIDVHVVWASVKHAFGDHGHTAEDRARTKKIPLSLSTVTVDDLQSVEKLLHALVYTVIPTAACKVTTELICREHFLPFAVTVIASLARLFVIEQKLLTEVRGAVIEGRLIFATHDAQNPQNYQNGQHPDVFEEIGEEVPQPIADTQLPSSSDCAKISAGIDGFNVKPTTQEDKSAESGKDVDEGTEKEPSVHNTFMNAPSLYAVMAEHNESVASVAQLSTKSIAVDVVSTPADIMIPHSLNSRESLPNAQKRIRVSVQGSRGDSSDLHELATEESVKDSQQGSVMHMVKRQRLEYHPEVESSMKSDQFSDAGKGSGDESEDIDDIFAALDG